LTVRGKCHHELGKASGGICLGTMYHISLDAVPVAARMAWRVGMRRWGSVC